MPLKRIELKEFADKLTSKIKHGRLAILAGAGISMVSPTSLPSGDELRDLATQTISASPELSQYFTLLTHDDNYKELLPEFMFQTLWEHIGPELGDFFQVLKPANQNAVHRFINLLYQDFGVPVATTNFEHLIEGFDKTKPNVLHLHGSLQKTRNIVIRLNQVGRTIPLQLADKFLHFVKGKTVLILGYSGRDSDVMSLIEKSEAENLMWLFHNDSDRAIDAATSSAHKVNGTIGHIIDLTKILQNNLQTAPPPIPLEVNNSSLEKQRYNILANWQKQLSTEKRFLALSSVLVLAKNFSAANEILIKGLISLRDSKFWNEFLVGAAAIFRLTANFEEGINCISEALANTKKTESPNHVRALNVSGLLLLEKTIPEPSIALKRFNKALFHLQKIKSINNGALNEIDTQLLARLHNNIGLAAEYSGDCATSIPAYRESIKIKRSIGDLIGIAQSSANLSIACYKERKYRKSRYWRDRALAAAETYGLDFLKSYLLRRIGTESCKQGRISWGIQKLKEANMSSEKIAGAEFDKELIGKAINQFLPKTRTSS